MFAPSVRFVLTAPLFKGETYPSSIPNSCQKPFGPLYVEKKDAVKYFA
jgi:hypothetical protein